MKIIISINQRLIRAIAALVSEHCELQPLEVCHYLDILNSPASRSYRKFTAHLIFYIRVEAELHNTDYRYTTHKNVDMMYRYDI